MASIELLPVPAWRGLQLSLSFPVLLAVGILYSPPAAALVAVVGSFDRKEVRREIAPVTALFNRSQIALSVFAGSIVFHTIASVESSWYVLIAGSVLATAADYSVNVMLVALYMRLVNGIPLPKILPQLRVGPLWEFLWSYLGLALVGVVIARLYLAVEIWAVAAFILPLVFARQMFFRSMALEDATKELRDRERVLRALSNRMAEERHEERMQIAGYLHDDLAQRLFVLTLQLELAKKRLGQGDMNGVVRNLEQIGATKDEAYDLVRALIRDLHRSPIGRTGLADALQSLVEDVGGDTSVRVSTDVSEVSLPPPIQLLIYQIAREAVMNALKHADARRLEISLGDTGDGVELVVRDDGKGFDTEAAGPEGHFGMVMMRERTVVAGGRFTVESGLGRGTTVIARFPAVWVEEGTRLESDSSSRSPSAHQSLSGSEDRTESEDTDGDKRKRMPSSVDNKTSPSRSRAISA